MPVLAVTMPPIMDTFPQWINRKFVEWQAAQGKRKTVEEFAIYLGISRPLLNMWMNGNKKPAKSTPSSTPSSKRSSYTETPSSWCSGNSSASIRASLLPALARFSVLIVLLDTALYCLVSTNISCIYKRKSAFKYNLEKYNKKPAFRLVFQSPHGRLLKVSWQ